MTNPDDCLLRACAAVWNESFIAGLRNSDNCSGFVKAVAHRLGIPIPETARADAIVDHIIGSWRELTSGEEAARQAGAGVLVIAGLKSSAHSPARTEGHVVIVVAGPLYRGQFPKVWGGSTGSAQSQGEKSVGEVWNRTDRSNVVYYAYAGANPVCR